MRSMIGFLQGTASGRVVMTPAGVGYVVHTPRPLTDGADVRLHVSTIVREDAITLFAFDTESERVTFEALCKVTGVGPSSALSILRDSGVDAVLNAVRHQDSSLLGKVRGVGPKIAERIAKETKLPDDLISGAAQEIGVDQEIANVLVTLGFDLPDALKAVATTSAELDEEERLAAALSYLRRDQR